MLRRPDDKIIPSRRVRVTMTREYEVPIDPSFEPKIMQGAANAALSADRDGFTYLQPWEFAPVDEGWRVTLTTLAADWPWENVMGETIWRDATEGEELPKGLSIHWPGHPFTIAYDCKLMRPGCILLQVAMGATITNETLSFAFGSEDWLVAPTPDLKVYNVPDEAFFRWLVIRSAQQALLRRTGQGPAKVLPNRPSDP